MHGSVVRPSKSVLLMHRPDPNSVAQPSIPNIYSVPVRPNAQFTSSYTQRLMSQRLPCTVLHRRARLSRRLLRRQPSLAPSRFCGGEVCVFRRRGCRPVLFLPGGLLCLAIPRLFPFRGELLLLLLFPPRLRFLCCKI